MAMQNAGCRSSWAGASAALSPVSPLSWSWTHQLRCPASLLHRCAHAGIRQRPVRGSLPAAVPGGKGDLSPLEVLRQENALLKETLKEAGQAVGLLEKEISAAGVTVPAADNDASRVPGPEDYWSAALEVPGNHEYVDNYGAITPIPNHDGTECFKWDKLLWSQEAHFKVGAAVVPRGAAQDIFINGLTLTRSTTCHAVHPHGALLTHAHSLMVQPPAKDT